MEIKRRLAMYLRERSELQEGTHDYGCNSGSSLRTVLLLLLLLLLKKFGSVRVRESDIHPISPKTSAPQYQPTDRKKRKGKRVEYYSRDRAA